MDSARYGTPPAPPLISKGAVPSQRLATQIPQYNVAEAPACVQNAMMTKDKKPFTYTPGGIDLSQIKSQRMAKRLARNAQNEGATGQQQLHRPTQSPQLNSNGGTMPGAASQLGATAMGMPFQVLPTGPPPPPPPQPKKAGAPPPPPPPSSALQNKLAPQSNGNSARRSPTPQTFEPPPMGFRPEIKIPPNPMATLKKVPPPQEKNNFWMEEYRKERSKSPMVGNDENDNNRSSPNNPQPETNHYSYNSNNNNSQETEYQPQQNQYRATQSPQPMRQQQEFYTQNNPSPPRTPVQSLEQQKRFESPYQTQCSQPQQSPSIQRQTSQYASPQYEQQAHQYSPQKQQSPVVQQQPSQQYQTSPQHSPQVQRQQSIQTPQYQSFPPQSPSVQQRPQTTSQQQYESPTPPQYQQQQQQQKQQSSPTQQQSVPWRQQKNVPSSAIQNNVSQTRDVMSPAPAESPKPQFLSQQQQQYPTYLRSREALSPAPELQPPQISQPYQQKNAQVGSIYIPPVAAQQPQTLSSPYQDPHGSRTLQQQQQQQTQRQVPTNRWMNAQGQTVETPNLNRINSPSPASASSNGFGSSNNAGLRLQINNNTSSSNAKERIIPIQLEQTPTPTRTPSAPGFGPQPFYNAQQQQYSSVPSPPLTQGIPNNGQNSPNYVIRSPNQFVDQGYNQYPGAQDHPTRVTSPPMQQSPRVIQQTNTAGGVRTRIIPIAIESQPDGPLNPNNARGPISQQPIVIQNDPRNQNTWGNNGSATPTQSKSFRILQKITDTSDENALETKVVDSDGGDQEPQLQRPSFARQMTSTGQINSPTIEQMKRMQLNNEQAFANRARNQEEDKKSASEDPRYRGPANPSKTFKKLQGAIERCSPSRTDQNGTSPVMKQPQPNRYVNQRPAYSPDEHSQQYVHPSEQQVPEPKKYTGSAIPSRSFKILQAMTTPENAAESDGSDVVETDTSVNEFPYQQQAPPSCPYPYPYLPPCCAHPPPPPSTSSSGGDINNWQYHSPYHHYHHPHHHHPYSPHHPHQHHLPQHPPIQHHPHQHPVYPYPPPCPCYYYNFPPNEYDSQNCSSRSSLSSRGSFSRGRSQSQDLPNIIITPSIDDVPHELSEERLARNEREGSVIDTLSRRLSEISKPEDNDLSVSQKDEKIKVENMDQQLRRSPSPTNESNEISSEESSENLLSSSLETSTSSSSEECADRLPSEGLQAIKSVTNIQFYNKKMMAEIEDDDRTIADNESMVFDEEEEEEIIGEELEYDEEVLIEEMDSEEEEEEIEAFEEEDVIIMDDLSVIYEENEADLISPRPTSRISSSVSETSTLANEESEAIDKEATKKIDDEDDNSNSVTVRLPLKFSFSRSSNDENIATIEVGNSQIEDKSISFSVASVEAEPDDYETDQDCDVSVTISLSRSSESLEKKVVIAPYLAGEIIADTKEESIWESDEDDVSVSFSLPMRNKFMDQTWNGDLTNNISIPKEEQKENSIIEEEVVDDWKNKSSLEESESEEEFIIVKKSPDNKVKNNASEKSLKTDSSGKESSNEDPEQENQQESKEDSSIGSSSKNQDMTNEINSKNLVEEVVNDELDFWETLQATRKEAQLFLEKTAGYWGKSVDGKEKPVLDSIDKPKPKEEEKDEDFWSNIRVKSEEKKETKPKTTKLKKKKKVVKVPPKEPEPEPETKLTIIKLPNANNKSKVVESALQMIQEKTKKPKKLVKQVSKEEVKVVKEALENEIVQIGKAVEEEKKLIEEAKTRRASLCKTKSIDGPKMEEEVIIKKEEETIKNKLVREKVELKTQILNQKFAKAFIFPDKPPLMRGILSEAEYKETISNVYRESASLKLSVSKQAISKDSNKSAKNIVSEAANEASISNRDINVEKTNVSVPKVLVSDEMERSAIASNEVVMQEPKKLVKKKVTKTKTVEENSEGNTLKPPKVKSVKKITTKSKTIKKKKEDKEESNFNIIDSKQSEKENNLPESVYQLVDGGKNEIIVKQLKEVEEKLDAMKISSSNLGEKIKTEKSDSFVKSKEDLSLIKTEAIDPWSNITASEAIEDMHSIKNKSEDSSKITSQEIDFWAEIESVTSKNISKSISVDKEPDFWVDIDLVTNKKDQHSNPHTLVESSKAKTQRKELADHIQTLEWSKIEVFESHLVQKSEVPIPNVLNGCCDYWPEISAKEYEIANINNETDCSVESSSTKLDLVKREENQIATTKLKTKSKKSVSTELEDKSFKPKSKRKISVPSENPDSQSTEKSIKINKENDLEYEVSGLKLKSRRKTSVPNDAQSTENTIQINNENDFSGPKFKSRKKTSVPNEETIDPASGTDILKTSVPSKKSEAQSTENTTKMNNENDLEYEVSGLKLKSRKKISVPNEETIESASGTEILKTSVSSEKSDAQSNENTIQINNENDFSGPKLKSRKKTSIPNEETIESGSSTEYSKPKKKHTRPEGFSNETSLKIKTKKKDTDSGEKRASTKSKSKKKHFVTEEDTTALWSSSSKASSSIKATKSCNLPVYSDYDIELIHADPEPIFYATQLEINTGISFWATVSYAEEESKAPVEQEYDFWAPENSHNDTESNAEIDTGKIDFWVTQRKFEANSGTVEESRPIQIEEPTEEVDFWAEIKGSNEETYEERPTNDDCELRRNNYKKAMAFFKNTVSVEPKEKPTKSLWDQEEPPSWFSSASTEPEYKIPEQLDTDNAFLIVEDNETTEDEPDTLIENNPHQSPVNDNDKQQQIIEEEDESQSSESMSDSTPNHFQIEHLYPKPEPESINKLQDELVDPIFNQPSEESKISVKDRIFAFETGTVEAPPATPKTSLIVDGTSPDSNLSRNSSQRSESEIEEDDSGVTDMNKPLSETDTESESFPELRKMSRYQRASTHSRLFKLLQDEGDVIEEEEPGDEEALEAEFNFKPRKKIIHNVSITRKQNPKALQEAETVSQRRQRLSLPLRKNQSIDADNPSSPNSPASPIQGQQSQPISDKLVNELIQSLLLKKSSTTLKNLPMEKLQAAAKRVLEEEFDSRENTSLDSTPALTPQEFKNESYADYYDTWSSKNDSDNSANGSFEILPSKAFKVLQETTGSAKRKPWAVRCPRVLSSKTVNRDLARVTESPEIVSRNSRSPEMFSSDRASSVGRWKKV